MSNAQGGARWGGLAENSTLREMRSQLASSSVTQFRQAISVAKQARMRLGSTTDTSVMQSLLGGSSAVSQADAKLAAALPALFDARCAP
jgi:hypothetical protein